MDGIDKLKEKLQRLQRCKCDCKKCNDAKLTMEINAKDMDVTVEFLIDAGGEREDRVKDLINQHCLGPKCCPISPPHDGTDNESGPRYYPRGEDDVFGLKR